MEFLFYAVLFSVVVFVVAGFVQTVIYPPVVLQPDQLPAAIQRELQNCCAEFVPLRIKHQKVRHRYQIEGTLVELNYYLEIDLTPDGELAETKLQDPLRSRKLLNLAPIPNSLVPIQLAERMQVVLAHDSSPICSSLAFCGLLESERAYQIKIQTDDFGYEFVLTESGQLVEFEKKNLGH